MRSTISDFTNRHVARALFITVCTAGIGRADVIVLYSPSELVAGGLTEVMLSFQASPGAPFDLGGVTWDFVSDSVALIEFRWAKGLDGPDWIHTEVLPAPQAAFLGAPGAGPIVSDGTPFPVATLTVMATGCASVLVDAVPLRVFESTTFAELKIAGGLPFNFDVPSSLDAAVGVGGRYLSVTPSPGELPIALLVRSPDFECLNRYVDADGRLVDTPVYQTPAEWALLRIGDIDIVPDTDYEIRSECTGLSLPVSGRTWRWGDVNDDDIVDLDDLLCVIAGFSGDFSQCSLHSLDLRGDLPDGVIDLDDVLAVVDAFSGDSYPGPDPCN